MSITAKSTRRWLGGLCLLTAIAMLIAGQTILEGRLGPLALFAYWSGCFILTGIAACFAILDASRIRHEQRDAQRALIENTLKDIEREKRSRQNSKG